MFIIHSSQFSFLNSTWTPRPVGLMCSVCESVVDLVSYFHSDLKKMMRIVITISIIVLILIIIMVVFIEIPIGQAQH